MKPIVWSIAGHDPSGGAGITLDVKVMHSLGVHACSIPTCDTVQTTQGVKQVKCVDLDWFEAQMGALQQDLPPKVIKLGALSEGCFDKILRQVQDDTFLICDPVVQASSGQIFLTVQHYQKHLHQVDLLTPNWPESAQLSGVNIQDHHDVPLAAAALHQQGVKAVLITGGHAEGEWVCDYFSDGEHAFWLTLPKLDQPSVHGTGCALSSAIAAMVAQGYDTKDAVVAAKMVVHQAIDQAQTLGQGADLLHTFSIPVQQKYLPSLCVGPNPIPSSQSHSFVSSRSPSRDLPPLTDKTLHQQPFPPCGDLGLYVIVDSVQWVKRLLELNVKTLQLRIKNQPISALSEQIKQSVALCKQHGAKLFINDYWQLAVEHGAYGVHLGQEDLDTADLHAIGQAGLRLGISTHCFYEVARAHACRPSYLAYGPIYHTDSKPMAFGPRGLAQLAYWQRTLDYPLVAIGGINVARLSEVLATSVKSVAVISAITQAKDVRQAVTQMKVN